MRSSISTIICWLLAGIWTLVICYLLLWPSKDTAVNEVSELFGGTEASDAVGHFGLAFVEAAVLYNLLRLYLSARSAWFVAILVTIALGIALESAQIVIPARGFTLMDLSANLLGIGLFVVVSSTIHHASRLTGISLKGKGRSVDSKHHEPHRNRS